MGIARWAAVVDGTAAGSTWRAGGRHLSRLGLMAWLLIVVVTAPLSAQPASSAQADLRPTVILISIDAWRADYHTRTPLPNLERLMARGVRAEHLIPVFPTKTFPNHYTIVTGLYPGRHGIVANNILDVATGRSFGLSKRQEVQDGMWWGGEPIWVTLERAGQRAAAMFWPGSEAPIQGVRPTFWMPFDATMPGSDRVARVLGWLDLPAAERPTFLTLYFEEVDSVGHGGPDLPALDDALRKADGWIGELVAGLEARGLADRVNLVIVSDHGMASTSLDRVVVLDDYISLADVDVVDLNPTLGLYPKPGKEDSVYRALRKAHPRLKVYRRQNTPRHWHYRDHPRIPPLVGAVDDGWQILTRDRVERLKARGLGQVSGQHGYDPRARSMRALLIAAGPAFRQGVVVKPFESVSLYNVFARILGVTPARNDGDPKVLKRLLR